MRKKGSDPSKPKAPPKKAKPPEGWCRWGQLPGHVRAVAPSAGVMAHYCEWETVPRRGPPRRSRDVLAPGWWVELLQGMSRVRWYTIDAPGTSAPDSRDEGIAAMLPQAVLQWVLAGERGPEMLIRARAFLTVIADPPDTPAGVFPSEAARLRRAVQFAAGHCLDTLTVCKPTDFWSNQP